MSVRFSSARKPKAPRLIAPYFLFVTRVLIFVLLHLNGVIIFPIMCFLHIMRSPRSCLSLSRFFFPRPDRSCARGLWSAVCSSSPLCGVTPHPSATILLALSCSRPHELPGLTELSLPIATLLLPYSCPTPPPKLWKLGHIQPLHTHGLPVWQPSLDL